MLVSEGTEGGRLDMFRVERVPRGLEAKRLALLVVNLDCTQQKWCGGPSWAVELVSGGGARSNIFKNFPLGTSLVVQQLRSHTSDAGGVALTPGQGTKVPRASCEV